jgi:hypothetical protein
MRCPVQEGHPELLLDYCARTLHPDTAAVLTHHLTTCSDCRELVEAQESVWSALDAWKPPRISDTFDELLYLRIRECERRRFWRRWLGAGLIRNPALPVAVVCGVLALLMLLPAPLPETPAAPRLAGPSAGDASEAEQFDRAVEDLEMLRQLGRRNI